MQDQEVIFSWRNIKIDHPAIYFNKAPSAHIPCQKHLGIHVNEKLNFSYRVKEKIAKSNTDT